MWRFRLWRLCLHNMANNGALSRILHHARNNGGPSAKTVQLVLTRVFDSSVTPAGPLDEDFLDMPASQL